MNDTIGAIEQHIKELFLNDTTGHDYFHLIRTKKIALQIQKKEGGNVDVICIAALLHDMHRIMQQEKGTYVSPKESLPRISEILSEFTLPSETVDHVLHCIAYHEEYPFATEFTPVTDIETLILQDADNIDALGAMGLARSFMYGGANHELLYDPDTLQTTEKYIVDKMRSSSVIHHIHEKILKLAEHMNTETGKRIAKERHDFMMQFLEQFQKEWDGF